MMYEICGPETGHILKCTSNIREIVGVSQQQGLILELKLNWTKFVFFRFTEVSFEQF